MTKKISKKHAQKILDFLCRRWEKNIRYYVDAKTIESVSIAKVMLEEIRQVIAAKIDTVKADGKHRSFSLAFTAAKTEKEPVIYLKMNDKRCSCSRILEKMLDAAENVDVNLHVFAFIHRGETLAELLVKADLEEIDD